MTSSIRIEVDFFSCFKDLLINKKIYKGSGKNIQAEE